MTGSNGVNLEIDDNGVGVLSVDRPEVMNALNWAGMETFRDRVREVRTNKHIRALVITGGGERSFISGGDLSELRHFPRIKDGRRLANLMGNTLQELDQLEMPVVAALNGHSRGGGCEIAVACDIRIVAKNASLGFVHVRQGITTAWGGTHRLKRLVGYGKAAELLLTGRVIGSEEALKIGLVEQAVPPNEVLSTSKSLAASIAAHPPQAVRALKRLLRLELNEAFLEEREMLAKLWATSDHLEAVKAFLEKRKPVFSFASDA